MKSSLTAVCQGVQTLSTDIFASGMGVVPHLTLGESTVTGVPLFLFAFLVRSLDMDGSPECRWLGTFPV